MTRLHGGCVAIAGRGVLLRGPPGAGKSTLALCLIDGGGRLVSDDQTDLIAADGRLFACPPANIAGLLEVRGAGIMQLPYLGLAEVRLVVDLVPPDQVARLPGPETVTLEGISVAGLRLDGHAPSTAARIHASLAFKLIGNQE